MPRIAVTVTAPDPQAEVDPRFGRAPFFMVFDTETEAWTGLANPALGAPGGAGVQAAQFLADSRVEAVVSGAFGPNAFKVLDAAGIAMFRFDSRDTCRQVMEAYQSGSLARAMQAAGRAGSGGGPA